MNNSIEIKPRSLLIGIIGIFLFAVVLFMMHTYDGSLKAKKIESSVLKLEDSIYTKEISKLLEGVDYDTVTVFKTKELLTKLNSIGREFPSIYSASSEIILTGDFGYKILRNNYSKEKKGKFVIRENMSNSLKEIIESLKSLDANVVKENIDFNSGKGSKRIIIPLNLSPSGSSFLNLNHYTRK